MPPPPPPPRAAGEAHKYFQDLCGPPDCPRCGTAQSYALKGGRLRCSGCGYTYHRFSLRFINRGGLPAEYWHAILHYFEQGLPPREAAERLSLTYPTVFKAYSTIRLAVTAASDDGRRLLDDKGDALRFCPGVNVEEDRPLCLTCRSPVLGVRENGNGAHLRVIPRLKAQAVFTMPLELKTWRTLVFSGPMQEWDGLIFCCCRTARSLFQAKFTQGPLRMEETGFYAFAEQWFARYHCLAPETSLPYLKEMELRYNLRGDSLYPVLSDALCALVSKRAH
ncbi:transposase [Desulfovibrio sp. X2]|uniref:transposase n=1 Tax=Desulfovibrio sp. X2 TaxID=941449 RepID=UPI00126821D5|nr:transposase [Desulfovibrio sp. X2]